MALQVRFWGVRGSVPWATPSGIGHGCNTPCVEVTDDETHDTIVVDAGSGVVGLGLGLGGPPREVPVVLTHYHWDHLQGLPFMAQLYEPGWTPRVFAPAFGTRDTAWVKSIFESPFFPVPYDHLPNRPDVELVEPGAMRLAGMDVSSIQLNHPGGALAYRIRGAAGDVVYATDHEFGDAAFDEPLAAFARGASAIILDAHFTPDEIAGHPGWGHSDWRRCAEFAASNDVGRLWLFHHKPGRTDDELARIETEARRVFAATSAASEGESFSV